MAAMTTTYFEGGRGWSARVAERNAELLAQQALRRRGVRTPEFYFAKHFDNTRLVKASDPVRVREMRVFSAAIAAMLTLVMIYGLQHFSAIEGGYRVEAEKQMLDQLRKHSPASVHSALLFSRTPKPTAGLAKTISNRSPHLQGRRISNAQ